MFQKEFSEELEVEKKGERVMSVDMKGDLEAGIVNGQKVGYLEIETSSRWWGMCW